MTQTLSAKTDKETTKRAISFLKNHTSGVLATVRPDGKPYASVVYYLIDANGMLSFITKSKTQKSINLRRNNQAYFVVYDEPSQTVLEVAGRVRVLEDEALSSLTFRNALKASIHTAGNAIPPISKIAAGGYVAYQIVSEYARITTYNRRSSEQPAGLSESFNLAC